MLPRSLLLVQLLAAVGLAQSDCAACTSTITFQPATTVTVGTVVSPIVTTITTTLLFGGQQKKRRSPARFCHNKHHAHHGSVISGYDSSPPTKGSSSPHSLSHGSYVAKPEYASPVPTKDSSAPHSLSHGDYHYASHEAGSVSSKVFSAGSHAGHSAHGPSQTPSHPPPGPSPNAISHGHSDAPSTFSRVVSSASAVHVSSSHISSAPCLCRESTTTTLDLITVEVTTTETVALALVTSSLYSGIGCGRKATQTLDLQVTGTAGRSQPTAGNGFDVRLAAPQANGDRAMIAEDWQLQQPRTFFTLDPETSALREYINEEVAGQRLAFDTPGTSPAIIFGLGNADARLGCSLSRLWDIETSVGNTDYGQLNCNSPEGGATWVLSEDFSVTLEGAPSADEGDNIVGIYARCMDYSHFEVNTHFLDTFEIVPEPEPLPEPETPAEPAPEG